MDPKALLNFNNLALELSNYPNFTNYALYVLMNNHTVLLEIITMLFYIRTNAKSIKKLI